MLQWISALPDNVVNNIFTTINTLICGLIVAFFYFYVFEEERGANKNLISSFMAWKINMRSTNCGWIPRYVNIWHLC